MRFRTILNLLFLWVACALAPQALAFDQCDKHSPEQMQRDALAARHLLPVSLFDRIDGIPVRLVNDDGEYPVAVISRSAAWKETSSIATKPPNRMVRCSTDRSGGLVMARPVARTDCRSGGASDRDAPTGLPAARS